MAENVKLKDLYADEKVYDGINTVKIPKADGTGNAKFIVPPSQKFMLRESDYQEDYVHGSGTNIAISEEDESGNFVFASIANTEMHISEPKIIGVATFAKDNGFSAYHSMTEQSITEFMTRIYQSEAEESVIVTPDTYVVKKGWTNIGHTVTTEGKIVRVAIEKFEQITDPSVFTFDACLPWRINEGKENYFYAYIAEATQQVKSVSVTENGTKIINPDSGKSGLSAVQLSVDVPTGTANLQDKSVAITENGTQEFSADTGYDGIKKLTATVNVAGGGGTGVQPDYAQNNSTAADYIKNRPGGYMVEHPSISKTITAADYVDYPNLHYVYKFSDDPLSVDEILGGTGKIKTITDGVETEIEITRIKLVGNISGVEKYAVDNAAGLEVYIVNGSVSSITGGTDGCYFAAKTDDNTGAITAYISEFATAAYSTTVEIPEKFTEVKPANWGSSYGTNGYIPGRPGGYVFSMEDLMKLRAGLYNYTWDGVIDGRDTIALSYGGTDATYVKITDDIQTIFAYVGGSITATVGETSKIVNITRDSIDIGSGGAFGIYTLSDSGERTPAPIVIFSYGNPSVDFKVLGVNIPQGVWFNYQENPSGGMTGYVNKITTRGDIGSTFMPLWPYEFIEQNPKTITTDGQTLTDAQKLQARTNIGTVEGTDKEMILSSSTAGSAKKFKITVTDDGTLHATEVTQ